MRRQSGFTLLEILVALTIMAISISAMLRVFSGNMRNIETASRYSRATLIAEEKMEKLLSTGLEIGESSGQSAANGSYSFETSVQQYGGRLGLTPEGVLPESSSGIAMPYLVTVTIRWSDAGQEKKLVLTTVKTRLEK